MTVIDKEIGFFFAERDAGILLRRSMLHLLEGYPRGSRLEKDLFDACMILKSRADELDPGGRCECANCQRE